MHTNTLNLLTGTGRYDTKQGMTPVLVTSKKINAHMSGWTILILSGTTTIGAALCVAMGHRWWRQRGEAYNAHQRPNRSQVSTSVVSKTSHWIVYGMKPLCCVARAITRSISTLFSWNPRSSGDATQEDNVFFVHRPIIRASDSQPVSVVHHHKASRPARETVCVSDDEWVTDSEEEEQERVRDSTNVPPPVSRNDVEHFYRSAEHREALRLFMQHLQRGGGEEFDIEDAGDYNDMNEEEEWEDEDEEDDILGLSREDVEYSGGAFDERILEHFLRGRSGEEDIEHNFYNDDDLHEDVDVDNEVWTYPPMGVYEEEDADGRSTTDLHYGGGGLSHQARDERIVK